MLFLAGVEPNLSKSTQHVFMDGFFSRLYIQETFQPTTGAKCKCMTGNYENSEGCESSDVEWKKPTKRSISACVNADGTHILEEVTTLQTERQKTSRNQILN